MLTAMGVGAFAERARRELLATGENVRKRRGISSRRQLRGALPGTRPASG